ncbi:sugar transferase [Candidatus Acetothermia bacterium]|nr:sugar transferase [Candidatus Acetothermia bacterium]MBI3643976.1 sugar transferase [Candidatus Acetothermia bacterium]
MSIQRALKSLIDIILSVIALILLAIPFVIFALLIKLESKGPVFFRQERVGKEGKLFKVWKFRTMIDKAIHQGLGYQAAIDDPRITRVGKFLRDFGLDELPQIFNVLVRDMSMVGPRPTLEYQVKHYDSNQRRRLAMKPGITSLAVVSGRNGLAWAKRIELDLQYIDQWSFWLDVKILFKTLWVVLIKREGLYGEEGVNDPFVTPPSPDEIRKSGKEHVQ